MCESKVSVIIPTYNRAYCVMDSINSVLDQTFGDFELILVDDGSTDDTKDVIDTVSDERLHYVFKENGGAASARNKGLELAQGEYIAFHDSDDIWALDKLELVLNEFEKHPEVGFVYHPIKYDFGGGAYAMIPQQNINVNELYGDIYERVLYDNLIGAPALMVRRECLNEIGNFDTTLNALEDYDMAIRLSYNYLAGYVDKPLVSCSYTSGSVSLNTANYISASCVLLDRYKAEMLRTNTFNHRLEKILTDAETIGCVEQVAQFLEKLFTG